MFSKYLKLINTTLRRIFFTLNFKYKKKFCYFFNFINKKIIIRYVEISISLQMYNESVTIDSAKKPK